MSTASISSDGDLTVTCSTRSGPQRSHKTSLARSASASVAVNRDPSEPTTPSRVVAVVSWDGRAPRARRVALVLYYTTAPPATDDLNCLVLALIFTPRQAAAAPASINIYQLFKFFPRLSRRRGAAVWLSYLLRFSGSSYGILFHGLRLLFPLCNAVYNVANVLVNSDINNCAHDTSVGHSMDICCVTMSTYLQFCAEIK